MIAGLAFASPALLLGLIALPILWLLLRAIPPAPIRRRFPGVALLLGLKDDESETDKTPLWLLILRALAVAAAIAGFAGPVLNPAPKAEGNGPLLVLAHSPAWASARPDERNAYKPGMAAEPARMDDWRNYVRMVGQRLQRATHGEKRRLQDIDLVDFSRRGLGN